MDECMLVRLQSDSSVSIFEQIVAQITFAIAAGDLPAGSLLPSVRQLAQEILVHANTIAKAWQELERRGLVVARQGRGMEVTSAAPELAQQQRRTIIEKRLRQAFNEALTSHLTVAEIRQIALAELDHANGRARQERS